MATSVQQIIDTYPLPSYRFNVTIGEESVPFSEVSGLSISRETIVYKDGLSRKIMPGQEAEVGLTLKKGMVRAGDFFFKWISTITLNQVEKRDISISLTDETGETPAITWKVFNAFPTTLTAPGFNAASNELAIETLELKADEIRIEFP